MPDPVLSRISGFADYSEHQNYLFGKWQDKLSKTFKLHGFTCLCPPPCEYAVNLQLKGGISKQIYQLARLQDGGLTDMALPFDRTVPLALYVARHINEITFPLKRYDISFSFRGEHAQAGRFRAFIQADVDIVDRDRNLLDDASCMAAVIKGLKSLEIPPFLVMLNHLDISKGILKFFNVEERLYPDVLRLVDKLDKLTEEQILKEGMDILSGKSKSDIKSLIENFSYKGDFKKFPLLNKMDEAGKIGVKELEHVLFLLEMHGVKETAFSPAMVRGLDYYTGIIFETFLIGSEKYGSIASGGRYDDLVSTFLKRSESIGGVGGSIGLTRLFDILSRENKLPKHGLSSVQIMILPRESSLMPRALNIVGQLRELGFNCDVYFKKGITKGLNFCDRKQIPIALMVMDEDKIVVKQLKGKTQLEANGIDPDILTFIHHGVNVS
jgi:histidyl-tRNA synthetase